MVIVNFVGHGFQWWRGNNPNPNAFVVAPNIELRMYVQQAAFDENGHFLAEENHGFRDGLYDANNTVPIIQQEMIGLFDGFMEQFHAGENCPEHFLINAMEAWDDIRRGGRPYVYLPGWQNIGIEGAPPLRIREFGPNNVNPPRFQPNRQFVCSPTFDESIFALNWLVNNIRPLLTNQPIFGIPIPNDEFIVLRWLVCRQPVRADIWEDIPGGINNLLGEARFIGGNVPIAPPPAEPAPVPPAAPVPHAAPAEPAPVPPVAPVPPADPAEPAPVPPAAPV